MFKKLALLLASLTLAAQIAQAQAFPNPPTADAVRDWAGLPPDVTLNQEKVSDAEIAQNVAIWGTPRWMYTYANPAASSATFTVGLFDPGTLWGSKRDLLTNNVQIQNSNGGTDGHLEYRPDGRIAYFTVMGSTASGSTVAGFTFLPRFDILVLEKVAAAPAPTAKTPGKSVSEVLLKVEGYLLGQ